MKKRNQSDRSRAKMWLAMLACMTVLVCGFFFAARQHFSSMDFGMKNSRLRKQIDDLESEKRRLLLAREVSLSATELKKAATRVKLTVGDAVTPELASLTTTVKNKVLGATPALAADQKAATSNPMIQKTVVTSPVNAKPITASLQKSALERPRTVDKKLIARNTTAAE